MVATVSRARLLIGLVAAPLAAEAVRIAVHSRAAVDPTRPTNRIVTDIDKAPRSANRKVEFSFTATVLRARERRAGSMEA